MDGSSPGHPEDDPTGSTRVVAVVHGRVQGVGYRYFAWREASDLDLAGWVSNESDGTVRCIAEGGRDRLDAFIERLRSGPPGAIVERIDATWTAPTGSLRPFGIRSGGHRGD